jgi:hypothetical protein
VHHVVPFAHGGTTSIGNLVLVCGRHHHRLHEPGWHAKVFPDATIEITTPEGRTHTSRPPPTEQDRVGAVAAAALSGWR